MLIRSKLMILGACAALTVALAPPAAAHHAFPAEFDAKPPGTPQRQDREGRVGEPTRLDSYRGYEAGRQ